MILGGYQKLTLIDYPGKLAVTVFTVGCSFRCPFCHNPELVLDSQRRAVSDASLMEDEFFAFLRKRRGKLDGVCITGGEPTIQNDIEEFIRKIKDLGYSVKLDSNGTRPDVLRRLIDAKLLDYIAMDIKSALNKYDRMTGVKGDKERIRLSVDMIRRSRIPYEFRTTVVPGLHKEEDFEEIAQWLKGSRAYYLQEYREAKILDPSLKRRTRGKSLDLEKIRDGLRASFGKVDIRR